MLEVFGHFGLSVIGALLPHLSDIIGLFRDKQNTQSALDEQAIKDLTHALRYKSIRVLVVVVVSVVVGLWAVDKVHDDLVHWNNYDYSFLHLFGTAGLSVSFKSLFSRFA